MFSLFDHGAVHLGSRSFVQRGENSIEPVLFSMSFAFMPYGHKADECNMTSYSARSESVHILDKLHCVMETSFLVDTA